MGIKESEELISETKPWTPYSKLTIKLRDSNFSPRWIAESSLWKALNEGWTVVKPDEVESAELLSIEDGSVVDGKIRRGRNLVLCKISKKHREERAKFYQAKTDRLLPTKKEELKNDTEGNMYGELEEKKEKGE